MQDAHVIMAHLHHVWDADYRMFEGNCIYVGKKMQTDVTGFYNELVILSE